MSNWSMQLLSVSSQARSTIAKKQLLSGLVLNLLLSGVTAAFAQTGDAPAPGGQGSTAGATVPADAGATTSSGSSGIPGKAETIIVTGQTPTVIGEFKFVQDGEPSAKLNIPTYEWIPKDREPDGMVLAVHGLTLHGERYELLGRACACT